MSHRDKTVNALLGLLLLVAFSVTVVLPIYLALVLVRYADRMLWTHVSDRLARFGPPEEVVYLSLLFLLVVAVGIHFVRKRYFSHK